MRDGRTVDTTRSNRLKRNCLTVRAKSAHTVAIQDDEIGFYYLSSRYYDSNIGRFITKDEIEYLGEGATTVSYNLYAYCLNNPVNRIDTEGNFSVEICVLIGFAVGVIYSAIDDYKDDHKLNASIGGKTYLENIVFGVVAGYCFGNIGAIIYEAVPSLISFSSSFFTMGTAIGVSSSAATLTSSVTITGADILIGTGVAVAAAGINMVLSKGYQRDKMGNNQRENKMFNNFVNKYHISDKDLIRRLHDNLVKYKKAKNVTFEKYKDLEYFLINLFIKFGKLKD